MFGLKLTDNPLGKPPAFVTEGRMVESVDTTDLKSVGSVRAGSSPAAPTKTYRRRQFPRGRLKELVFEHSSPGKTIEDLAKELGAFENNVRAAVCEYGLPFKRKKGELTKLLMTLCNGKKTVEQMSKITGADKNTIYNIISRYQLHYKKVRKRRTRSSAVRTGRS